MQKWMLGTLVLSATMGAGFAPKAAIANPPTGGQNLPAAAAEQKDKSVITTLKGHTNWVLGVAVSDDGRTAITSAMDGTVRVWEADTGREKFVVISPRWNHSVAISPDGKEFVVGGTSRILAFDIATGKETWRYKSSKLTTIFKAVHFDRANHLACAASNGTVYIWNYLKRDAPPREIMASRKPDDEQVRKTTSAHLYACCLSPAGSQLALSTHTVYAGSSEIEIWDVAGNRLVRKIIADRGNIYHLEFSADGKHLLSCGHSTTLGWIDRRELSSANNEDSVILWDATTGKVIRKFGIKLPPAVDPPRPPDLPLNVAVVVGRPENTRITNAVKFSPDGKQIITAERDGSIQIYSVDSGKPLITLRRHSDEARCVALSANGKRLISVSMDKTGLVWDWKEILTRKE